MEHYRQIAGLFSSKEALERRGKEGEYVHPALRDINLTLKALRDADAEAAHREHNPDEQEMER